MQEQIIIYINTFIYTNYLRFDYNKFHGPFCEWMNGVKPINIETAFIASRWSKGAVDLALPVLKHNYSQHN